MEAEDLACRIHQYIYSAGVSVALMIPSVAELLDGDKCFELIEEVFDISASYWPSNFIT